MLCEVSGMQWQHHPIPKIEAIERQTRARRGAVFGATHKDRQYHDFDSPIRWFPHRTPLREVAMQFHKVVRDRVDGVKKELENAKVAESWGSSIRGQTSQSSHSSQVVKIEEDLQQAMEFIWKDGELEKTDVRPFVYSIENAERMIEIPIPVQHLQNPAKAVGPGSGVEKLEELKKVGGWCILDPFAHSFETVGEDDRKVYQHLASWLKKNDKVRLVSSYLFRFLRYTFN